MKAREIPDVDPKDWPKSFKPIPIKDGGGKATPCCFASLAQRRRLAFLSNSIALHRCAEEEKAHPLLCLLSSFARAVRAGWRSWRRSSPATTRTRSETSTSRSGSLGTTRRAPKELRCVSDARRLSSQRTSLDRTVFLARSGLGRAAALGRPAEDDDARGCPPQTLTTRPLERKGGSVSRRPRFWEVLISALFIVRVAPV